MRSAFISIIALAAASLASGVAHASVIVAPSSVSSPGGDFGGNYSLVNLINQSGLSTPYVSGVTDFAGYTATATHAEDQNGLPAGFVLASGEPQTIVFTFDAPTLLNGIAIWAVKNEGSIVSFSLSGVSGTFTALASGGPDPDPAQDFVFDPMLVSSVTLTALNTAGGTVTQPGLGAVAFSVMDQATAVPEPGSLALIWVGLAGLGLVRRRD